MTDIEIFDRLINSTWEQRLMSLREPTPNNVERGERLVGGLIGVSLQHGPGDTSPVRLFLWAGNSLCFRLPSNQFLRPQALHWLARYYDGATEDNSGVLISLSIDAQNIPATYHGGHEHRRIEPGIWYRLGLCQHRMLSPHPTQEAPSNEVIFRRPLSEGYNPDSPFMSPSATTTARAVVEGDGFGNVMHTMLAGNSASFISAADFDRVVLRMQQHVRRNPTVGWIIPPWAFDEPPPREPITVSTKPPRPMRRIDPLPLP